MSDENTKIDLNTVDAKAAIESAVSEATIGLRKNRDDLLHEKKMLSESLKKFEGIDIDKVRDMMTNIGKSEETKLIADGKLEDVWALRSTAMQSNFDKELNVRDSKITELKDNATNLKSRLEDLRLDTVIRDAAIKNKILPTAFSDAILLGRSLFSMRDDGTLAIVDDNGFVQPGLDGKSPIQPEEWLKSLNDKKPHWWAQSNGIGATGGAGSSGNNKTLGRDQFDNMSQRDRSTFISGGGKIT